MAPHLGAVHRFAAAWADGVDLPPAGDIPPPPGGLDERTLRWCGQILSQLLTLAEETYRAQAEAALQQHLGDLQAAQDSQAQVFGEMRGVVTNLEAQLASERARNERLMDRLEKLQGQHLDLADSYLKKRESAPGPDGQRSAAPTPTAPLTSTTEAK